MLILDTFSECPLCEGALQIAQVLSSNSIDAVYWSDGYIGGPFIPGDLNVGICPHCSRLLWKNELRMDSSRAPNVFGAPEEIKNKPIPLRCVDKSGMAAAIAATGDRDKLRYLRQTLWHSHNSAVRRWWAALDRTNTKHFSLNERLALDTEALQDRYKASVPPPVQPPEFEWNLKELLGLFSGNTTDDGLLRAEAFRETGQFDECLRQLEGVVGANKWMSAQIADRAQRQESKVFQYLNRVNKVA